MNLEDYLRDYFGIRNSAKDMFYGYQGPGSNSSYAGYTYGNSYGGGTNGSAYGGWTASNPLSGNNAFSGNMGSSGFGGNPNYDPRMGMMNGGSKNAGGGGSGWNLQAAMQQVGGGPSGGNYGTGTSYQGISPVGAGGGQKFGGGQFDAPGGLQIRGPYVPPRQDPGYAPAIASNSHNAVARFTGSSGASPDPNSGNTSGRSPEQYPKYIVDPSTGRMVLAPDQGADRKSDFDNSGPEGGSGRYDGKYNQGTFEDTSRLNQLQVPFVAGAVGQVYQPQYQPQYQPGKYYPDPIQAGQIDQLMRKQFGQDYNYDPAGSIYDYEAGGGGDGGE